MKRQIHKFNQVITVEIVLLGLLFSCSLIATYHFFQTGLNIPYADAVARLNLSRKLIDNLNPGMAQLGSVWLPLPQLLMLPFIWNDWMWRTGMAGAIMSMLSYIVGGFFLYKSAFLLSKNKVASLLSVTVYALNINMLYLQTTAMSEAIFVALLSVSTYGFLKWTITKMRRYLVYAAFAVSSLTLIRYEALAYLLGSILLVLIVSTFQHYKINWRKIEGDIILYIFVAGLGFALWTLYLTAIFNDPLFWINYYATEKVTSDGVVQGYSQAKPFLAAVWQYFTSISWMSGIIPVGTALIGFVLAGIESIRKKSLTFLVLGLPLSIFLVMVLTLQRNTPIVQPFLTFINILSVDTSLSTGFNIRYGILLLPWVALLTVYVFKIKYLNILFFMLFSVQLLNHFNPQFSPMYEIPRQIYPKPDSDLVHFMQQNYNGGKILISASGFEDQMFLMGFPYRTYIHEGAGKYWDEALDRPARYADWIIIDMNRGSDWLAREMKGKQYWNWDHEVVWEGESVQVYKIKTQPDIIIE